MLCVHLFLQLVQQRWVNRLFCGSTFSLGDNVLGNLCFSLSFGLCLCLFFCLLGSLGSSYLFQFFLRLASALFGCGFLFLCFLLYSGLLIGSSLGSLLLGKQRVQCLFLLRLYCLCVQVLAIAAIHGIHLAGVLGYASTFTLRCWFSCSRILCSLV